MKHYSKPIIEQIALVMAESFMDDPMNQAVLDGVEKKEKLLATHAFIHARHAINNGTITLLDGNPKAFIIGSDSNNERKFKEVLLMVKIYLKTIQVLGFRDLRKIFANNKKTSKALSFTWQKAFITGRYYRVKIVAVDKSLRGQGAFRKLITPAIEYADGQQIPMVLETHNPENVGLYGHFGFKLMKTIAHPCTEIQQYCMIRKPLAYNTE